MQVGAVCLKAYRHLLRRSEPITHAYGALDTAACYCVRVAAAPTLSLARLLRERYITLTSITKQLAMPQKPTVASNTVLEDVSAEIGWGATSRLVGWFGGKKLYVPKSPQLSGSLPFVLGDAPMRRLCIAFGEETLRIPTDSQRDLFKTRRIVYDLLLAKMSFEDIARVVSLSPRRIAQIRDDMLSAGVLQT